MLNEAYEQGRQEALAEIEKVAGYEFMEKVAGQDAATVIGGLVPIAAGLGAEKGKGWRTTGGAVGGSILGSTAGHAIGKALSRKNPLMGALYGRGIGGTIGGAAGANYMHGKDSKGKRKK